MERHGVASLLTPPLVHADAPRAPLLQRGGGVTCACCASGAPCDALSGASPELSSLRESRDSERALSLVAQLLAGGHAPGPKLWTKLIGVLSACRRPRAAEAVLRDMAAAGTPPDAVAYSAVAHAWCAADSAEDAARVLGLMTAAGLRPVPGTHGMLLQVLASDGRLEEAQRLLGSMEAGGVALLEEHLNAVVRGVASRPDGVGAAEQLLLRMHNDSQNMELVARRGYTLRPSAVTYGFVMDAYAEKGEVQAVRRLLEQMRWWRVPPRTSTFNQLIKSFARAGRPDAAEAVLREMLGSGSWDMDALGVVPNPISYCAVADAWATAGQPARARAVLLRGATATGAPLDEVAWCVLVKAHGVAGQPREAAAILAEMEAAGVPPGPVTRTAAVAALCAGNMRDEAEAALSADAASPSPSRLPAAAYARVVCAHVGAGDGGGVSRALSLAAVAGRARHPELRAALARSLADAGLATDVADAAADRLVAAAVAKAGGSARVASAGHAPHAPYDGLSPPQPPPVGAARAAENARSRERAAAGRQQRVGGDGWLTLSPRGQTKAALARGAVAASASAPAGRRGGRPVARGVTLRVLIRAF